MVTNSDGTRNRLVFKDPPEENFAGQRAFPHASFPCRAANSSIGAIAGPQPSAMLLPQLAHQPAADQPGQGLNEKVPGEVLVLVGRPAAHRVVPHHRSDLAVKEGKPRRAVGQPADIVKSFAHQTLGLAHQAPMRAAADRLYEGKHETLGRFGSEKVVVAGVQYVADEKPERGLGPCRCASPAPKSGLATGNLPEPVAAQAPAGLP